MTLFLSGIAILIVGYYTYGRFIEKILRPDDRQVPAIRLNDGVDYKVLPHWKNMLIQLLNIAGIGPVIGVILGIKFGSIVFLIIPIGNILGGSVHDFVSGMYYLRHDGCNAPSLIRFALGRAYNLFACILICFLLLSVVAVFIDTPASILNNLIQTENFQPLWYVIGIIFLYYVLATLFPIDQIIGRFYPWFGGLLLLGTAALFFAILYQGFFTSTDFFMETAAFRGSIPQQGPIVPCLFVTIACGILSGFHATQSTIVARTIASEKQARSTYYGMMVVEGLIAMIWAAGALAVYNLFPEYLTKAAPLTLSQIANYFLGTWVGSLTVLAVIILAITTGDTALRSLRLTLAEIFHIPQKTLVSRFAVSLPLMFLVAGILAWAHCDKNSFDILWHYFAWGNQFLAASILMACTVWLYSEKRISWVTLLPGIFMTFVVLSYILWTDGSGSNPYGFGLALPNAYALAAVLTGIVTLGVVCRCIVVRKRVAQKRERP
ncbi:MAG: carbon starvation CstA family protein [Planctomycetia bacterium]|nr:carbon starvation CstA family protein [Planctomycetia bacterium]